MFRGFRVSIKERGGRKPPCSSSSFCLRLVPVSAPSPLRSASHRPATSTGGQKDSTTTVQRHWGHPPTREEMGPPVAAEGRHWGRLKPQGRPGGHPPTGEKKERERTTVRVEGEIMGESDRAWGSTALRARCSRQARASKRAQSHMCRYARAHAHAQARGRQGTGEAGRGRHKPGANAILDKGASGWVAESADAVRARAPGGS